MAAHERTDKSTEEVPIYEEIILEHPIADFQWYDAKQVLSENRIRSLSRINVFVGANNSGKSRALRAIFQSELSYVTVLMSINNLKELAAKVKKEIEETLTSSYKFHENYGYDNFNSIKNYPYDYNKLKQKSLSELIDQNLDKFLIEMNPNSIVKSATNNMSDKDLETLIVGNIKKIVEKYHEQLLEFKKQNLLPFQKRIYIPTLRGMRPFEISKETEFRNLYRERTIQDYFNSIETKLTDEKEVFTGLELYEELTKINGSNLKIIEKRRKYQDWLSEKFFQGKSIELNPQSESPGIVHIKIGDEDEFPIYQLGDGIQNLIILTYKIFTEESCLFFIEEPELFMHPGMQRIFIEVLSLFPKHQFFLVTHSNHILGMTLDHPGISIFHFSKAIKEEKLIFKVNNISNDGQRVLKDLGVSNSSVFLSNSTIWIEGITDRKYIRFFMDRYLEFIGVEHKNYMTFSNYREDLHYSFVIYQGGGLAHWDFSEDSDSKDEIDEIKASFVCANAIVIADGDAETKPRGIKTKAILGEKCYFFPTKEIENILPADFILEFCKKTLKLDNFSEKIIRADYEKLTIGLGGYLDNLFGKEKPYFGKDMSKETKDLDSSTQVFKDAKLSRTLKEHRKKKLCNFCLDNFKTYKLKLEEDIRIIELCEKIFAHIADCNGDKLA